MTDRIEPKSVFEFAIETVLESKDVSTKFISPEQWAQVQEILGIQAHSIYVTSGVVNWSKD